MDKAFQIQKQARDNVKSVQSYLTDLQNWESEMKRKEAALNGEFEQDLPPVRSKIKKEKPVASVRKKQEKRILASDYQAWEKFDVDKACEEVEMEDIGPTSLDSKRSQSIKLEKLREEAQYQKERGNAFVKQQKWDEAIGCYNRAIELVQEDAIYFANRGLCHLKKGSLHLAESDCTKAIKLDPTYVKAYQRRAAAREKLGSLRGASHDLAEVVKLEPHNAAANNQLETVRARMGTKGVKVKSSPASTPTMESRPITTNHAPNIVKINEDFLSEPERTTKEPTSVIEMTSTECWQNGIGENITVIKPVKKPPHLRSKRPLKPVSITEIPIGEIPVKSDNKGTRIKIVEIDEGSKGDHIDLQDSENMKEIVNGEGDLDDKLEISDNKDDYTLMKNGNLNNFKSSPDNILSPESEKLNSDLATKEVNLVNIDSLVPPMNSVQFISEWKHLKDKGNGRLEYLKIIDPSKIPSIFYNALESDVLSEILETMAKDTVKLEDMKISSYLKAFTKVKRFSALAMFLSDCDKGAVKSLLEHCRMVEGCSDEEISDLKNKFEV